MKKSILGLALLAACAPRPMSLTSAMPTPAPPAYTCAMTKVVRLGYVVMSGDSALTYLLAVKETKHHMIPLFGGNIMRDQLTVSMVKADSVSPALRVIASTDQEVTFLWNTQSRPQPTSRQAQTDAGVVLSACTNITE